MHTIHHLYPRSKGGTNEKNNKLSLPEKFHVNLHRVFDNDTPVEQIQRLLVVNDTCLTKEFKREMSHILTGGFEEYYYKDGVWRK